MCGLVGLFGEPDAKMVHAINDLLQLDVVRGPDSTGLGVIGNRHYTVLKEVGVPWFLLNSKNYKRNVLKKGNSNCGYIGHNRAATRGKVNVDNAHPFLHDSIMLTHNGTLNTVYNIKPDYKAFDTDSETICHHIAYKGVESLWNKLQGAAALAWYDGSDDTVHLLRNDKRPLAYAYTEDYKQMLYSSEPGILKAVCWRRNIKLAKDTIYGLTPNSHMEFSRGKGVIQVTQKMLPAFKPVVPQESKWQKEQREKAQQGKRNFGKGAGDKEPLMLSAPYQVCPVADDIPVSKKGISEALFYSNYEECVWCHGELDYDTSLIIDDRKAACTGCANVASLIGMRNEGAFGT